MSRIESGSHEKKGKRLGWDRATKLHLLANVLGLSV
jgi:hypothetical protein